jgi:ribonuclease HII
MDPASDRLVLERDLVGRGLSRIAGVDEAGRGPLAGPVVAAAVVLPASLILEGLPVAVAGLNDSKQLTARQRDAYFDWITSHSAVRFGLARVDAPAIDAANILEATHRAMRQALASLDPPPEHALVDGRPVPRLPCPHTPLVGGDARSYSIAAASVLAKVTRDQLMVEFDRLYPGYGFAAHKGYGTPDHLRALAALGPCPIHRRSFAPLRLRQPELL